jgi:anti-sigma regulatory factor (Ser/Thr protein kinase)
MEAGNAAVQAPSGRAEVYRLLSLPGEISLARAWVEARAKCAHVDGADLFAIKMGLTEALSNVVCHGYREGVGEIRVALEITPDSIVLWIDDEAPAYRPARKSSGAAEVPRLPDRVPRAFRINAGGGYGLPIIHSLMDHVAYGQGRGRSGNRLVMLRRRAPRRSLEVRTESR